MDTQLIGYVCFVAGIFCLVVAVRRWFDGRDDDA
jgi:hypothetical protein